RSQERHCIGGGTRGYIALNIPLLVLSLPFWDVSIDKGTAGEPELRTSAFHVSLYPSGDNERPPEPIMSIVWEAANLGELTRRLNELFDFFVDEVKLAAPRS